MTKFDTIMLTNVKTEKHEAPYEIKKNVYENIGVQYRINPQHINELIIQKLLGSVCDN